MALPAVFVERKSSRGGNDHQSCIPNVRRSGQAPGRASIMLGALSFRVVCERGNRKMLPSEEITKIHAGELRDAERVYEKTTRQRACDARQELHNAEWL